MPGAGTFRNRDAQLTWMGRSKHNGRDCALMGYKQRHFNPLEITNGAMKLQGRSHYRGQIWVALATRQTPNTLHFTKMSLGELSVTGQDAPQVVSVFRSGIFEPVITK